MTFSRSSLRTAKVGWSEGTVRAKRLITRDGRIAVQYLVKPRSKAAEKRYQMRRRINEIKAQQLSTDIIDQMSPAEIRTARDELADLEGRLAR